MWAAGGALWGVIALWGAIAWSHPHPGTATAQASIPASTGPREIRHRRALLAAHPPVEGSTAASPDTGRREITPRAVRRAPVVRILPPPVVPVTQTQTS